MLALAVVVRLFDDHRVVVQLVVMLALAVKLVVKRRLFNMVVKYVPCPYLWHQCS
jgi:hypothetical protein